MELAGSLLDIIKSVWTSLTRQIGYVKDFKKNFENLNGRAKELYAWRDDLNREIAKDVEETMPTSSCKAWLDKVGKIENQINEIEKTYEEKERSMRGWCPDVSSRRKLGKRVVQTIHHIKEISKYEGSVVASAPPKKAVIIPAPIIETETSTDHNLKKIMKLIRDERIKIIGFWGMGGVGKTTLMTILNNLPEITEMFDIVIWVTISKEWNLRKVQKEIAKRLGLAINEGETSDWVARRLFGKLQTTKCLLLLDDLWNKVDLEKVGVPCPDHSNYCKIVLTTRSLKVCNMMETDENLKVEVLSKEEAWKLFHQKAGEVVDSPDIQPFAKEVVKECGGLPLVIIVVGASLRNETDVPVWRNALRVLKSPATATHEIEEMEEKVFIPLEYSYNRLRSDSIKNCFLYAALYPEDSWIPKFELIGYWMGEGLLCDVNTLVEARDKGRTILKSLIDASLFEIVESNDSHIKMHDVIRDMALRITSPSKQEGCRFLVKAGVKLEKPPKDEEWEQVERISLMYNHLQSLPEMPKCLTLSTLLLQSFSRKLQLLKIPESFFMHMPSLRVLDLSNTGIKTLPKSICKLVSLRALYLNDCHQLTTLPSEVGALTRLEVLHLGATNCDSSIEYLPIAVGELSRLRSLRLPFDIFVRNDEKMKQQQLQLLSRLSLLEELIIVSDPLTFGNVDGIVEEVCKLKQLTNLQFTFPAVDYLHYFLQRSHSWIDGHLASFHFHVESEKRLGQYGWWTEVLKEYQYIDYMGGDSISPAIDEVLKRANNFRLQAHRTVQKLSDFGLENIKGLKHCTVGSCKLMESILEDGIDALPCLEVLDVSDLPMLKSLWKGSVPPRRLVRLRVWNCPNLKRLPLGIHNATTLKKIEGERKWWDALEWEDDAIKLQLQPLFVLCK